MASGTFWKVFLCTQVVGNLLYYRFLNPAVVAPDAFDIVAMAAGSTLAAPQRHALGAVAQLLQHAAAGKIFSGESQHLQVLNGYLEDMHLKFRSWVLAAYFSLALSLLLMGHTLLYSLEKSEKENSRGQGIGGAWRAAVSLSGTERTINKLVWVVPRQGGPDKRRAGAEASINLDLTWMVAI